MICKTLKDIYTTKPATNAAIRKSENKLWREGLVAVKFCEYFAWDDAYICFPANDAGDDVFVRHVGNLYPFQITEMAPRNKKVQEAFPKSKTMEHGLLLSEPYGSLENEVSQFVCELVQKKDDKNYANQSNMNLLIYINPDGAVFIDPDQDINQAELQQRVSTSKFQTISLCTGQDVVFIKGDIASLAAGQFSTLKG